MLLHGGSAPVKRCMEATPSEAPHMKECIKATPLEAPRPQKNTSNLLSRRLHTYKKVRRRGRPMRANARKNALKLLPRRLRICKRFLKATTKIASNLLPQRLCAHEKMHQGGDHISTNDACKSALKLRPRRLRICKKCIKAVHPEAS